MELKIQNALFDPLLELADQFNCSMEMATYLAIMKAGGPKKLFLWYGNADWQGVGKVIPALFRSSLLPCTDDLELALLLTRVWLQSGSTDQQREQWAKRWQIDHDALLYSIEPERDRLLAERFYNKSAAECVRSIDLLLMPKVRLLIAYYLVHLKYECLRHDIGFALKGDIYSSNQQRKVMRIHPDSICYGRLIDMCLYFFTDQEKGQEEIEAQQVILISPAWLRWLQQKEHDLYDLAQFIVAQTHDERNVEIVQRWNSTRRLFLGQNIYILHRRMKVD